MSRIPSQYLFIESCEKKTLQKFGGYLIETPCRNSILLINAICLIKCWFFLIWFFFLILDARWLWLCEWQWRIDYIGSYKGYDQSVCWAGKWYVIVIYAVISKYSSYNVQSQTPINLITLLITLQFQYRNQNWLNFNCTWI